MKLKPLQEPLDTSQPISVFLNLINDIIQYYSEANTLCMPEQVLQMAYHTLSSSGIYSDACKYWCRNPRAEKTWDNFKTIAVDYNDLRVKQH